MENKINLYRRNGKLIYIKMPEFNELAFVKDLWGDKKNMGDFGEVYSFPREKWEGFYKKMVAPTDGKNFYCLIYDLKNNPIGEVSFHGYNSATKVARINIKVHYEHRKNGYGEEALRLFLEYYFFEFGGEAIIDSVKTDEGKSLLKKVGFEEINNFRNQGTYKLTKNKFISCKNNNKIKVAVLSYDNIDLVEYTLPFNIFNKVNKIIKENYYKIYSLSNVSKVKSQYGIIDINNNIYDVDICPDILIIPGGDGISKGIYNKELIEYIKNVYYNCEYIVTFSTGVYLLNDFINIENSSLVVTNDAIETVDKESISLVSKGRILSSDNLIGNIDLIINIVSKISGEEVANKLAKEIGYLY